MAKKKSTAPKGRMVIVGHGTGLKYGWTTESTQAIIDRGTVVLRDAGNIFRYVVAVTDSQMPATLARLGPIDASNNRISKPCLEIGITDVKAVYVVSDEARARFAAVVK